MKANDYIREIIPKYSKPKSKKQVKIMHPADVHKLFNDISDDALEKFIVVYLDNQNKVNCFQVIATGSLDEVKVYPDEIIRTALITGSTQLIVLHNHPSGSLEPSAQDLKLTREITKMLEMFHINLLEHLIIAGDSFYSLHDHGLINESK